MRKVKFYLSLLPLFTLLFTALSTSAQPSGVITIPVVVHVLYNIPEENISDAQIATQLQVLNEDFRRQNTDTDNLWPQAADTEIEFCLSGRNPTGFVDCGISRTYTSVLSFPEGSNDMKSSSTNGVDPWPSADYLNIWVCDIDGLSGTATAPGSDPTLDGIVVDYRQFGTIGDLHHDFNLGRTATRLIGSWLNLRTIWGDGDCFDDDFVSDTPVSNGPNYGCDIGHISCGSVDMVQNYMDGSDDVCKNLFTLGQKNRMRATFVSGGSRESILNSLGCSAPFAANAFILTINFDDYPADISWEVKDSLNVVLHSGGNYPNNTYANQTISYTFDLPDGAYTFTIADSYGDGLCCNEGAGDYVLSDPYETIYDSDGTFGSGETINFNLDKKYFKFIGPGENWEDDANWNREVPGDCYLDKIYIESDCYKIDPFTVKDQIEIIVQDTVTLEFR